MKNKFSFAEPTATLITECANSPIPFWPAETHLSFAEYVIHRCNIHEYQSPKNNSRS